MVHNRWSPQWMKHCWIVSWTYINSSWAEDWTPAVTSPNPADRAEFIPALVSAKGRNHCQLYLGNWDPKIKPAVKVGCEALPVESARIVAILDSATWICITHLTKPDSNYPRNLKTSKKYLACLPVPAVTVSCTGWTAFPHVVVYA